MKNSDVLGHREIDRKELCHDSLGASFEKALSLYDTQRRVDVLIDDFMVDKDLKGMKALDAGCGLGYFSRRLVERGANVTAVDLGPTMVELTRQRAKCDAVQADVLNLRQKFSKETFDLVVSSECIEHTPDPKLAIKEMAALVKPNGLLVISTPNIIWYPIVRLATLLKLRPFDGYENFSSWSQLRSWLEAENIEIVREKGVHLFPFHFGMHRLSTFLDDHAQFLRGLMINICIMGRKRS